MIKARSKPAPRWLGVGCQAARIAHLWGGWHSMQLVRLVTPAPVRVALLWRPWLQRCVGCYCTSTCLPSCCAGCLQL